MTLKNDPDNQRSTHRFPVVGLREAELVVGSRRFPVRLEDLSAGGVGIRARAIPPLDTGDLVCLETTDEYFEARVAHVAMVEKPNESFLGGGINLEIKVGLERVQDLPHPKKRSARAYMTVWRTLVSLPSEHQISTLVSGIILVLVAGAIPFAVMILMRYANVELPALRWSASPSRPAQGWVHAPPPRPAHEDDQKPPPAQPPASTPDWAGAAAADPWVLHEADVRRLLEPETIRRLGLTAEQQEQIGQIVDAIDDPLTWFVLTLDEPESAGPQEQADSLPDLLLDQFRQILTDQQQAQWRAIRQEPPPPDAP
jgi:hypothetical protein